MILRAAKNTVAARAWRGSFGRLQDNSGQETLRRLAWLLTIGLVLLVFLQLAAQFRLNIWDRDIFDALAQRGRCRSIASGASVRAARRCNREPGSCRRVRAHDHAAQMARMADRTPDRAPAGARSLLPAQSGARRSPESRSSYFAGCPRGDRSSGRFRHGYLILDGHRDYINWSSMVCGRRSRHRSGGSVADHSEDISYWQPSSTRCWPASRWS